MCQRRTHSVLRSTLCCAFKSVCNVWFYYQWQVCNTSKYFTLSKHSKQCNIKQTARRKRLYVHTDKRLNQTWSDASSSWGLNWIEHSSMNQTTNKVNDVTSGLSVLYLKGCASETNVIGQLPRTLCFPLSMVLHLKRQCGDRICRETLQQKTKWKRLPQCTSWQQPTVRGLNPLSLRSFCRETLQPKIHLSGLSELEWSPQTQDLERSHHFVSLTIILKGQGFKIASPCLQQIPLKTFNLTQGYICNKQLLQHGSLPERTACS